MASIDAPDLLEAIVPEGHEVVAECKVIPLRVVESEVNEGLVLLLEDMLEKAKAGELTAIAGVGIMTRGRGARITAGNLSAQILGLLGALKARLERDWNERE
jgi:hypothetical protein